jgi:putative heme-binding domain-containing protein
VNAALAASRFNFKERPAELKSALLKSINSGSLPNGPRLEVLASVANALKLEDDLFEYLCTQLNDKASPAERRHAITALARASLTEDQLRALLDNLKQSNPIDFTQLLAIYEKPASEALGHELISALKQSRAISTLSSGDQLQRVFAKYPESVKRTANELYASINIDATRQSARIEELLPKLTGGDIRRGQAIFNSQAAACSSCHAIGYLGGELGPDLTRIGQVRTERDLLEAILYPSASFVRSYEPILVETKDGELHSGILKKDSPDELILATGPGAEVRLPRTEVSDTRPGKLSVMPQGLDEQLTTEQLADLLAFLKATRW